MTKKLRCKIGFHLKDRDSRYSMCRDCGAYLDYDLCGIGIIKEEMDNNLSILIFPFLLIIFLIVTYYLVGLFIEYWTLWFWILFLFIVFCGILKIFEEDNWSARSGGLFGSIMIMGFLVIILNSTETETQENEIIEKNIINNTKIVLNDLKPIDSLFEECNKLDDDNNIQIHGTYIIWDIDDSIIYAPNYTTIYLYPEGVTYKPPINYDLVPDIPYIDFKEITFFMIKTEKLEYVGSFNYDSTVPGIKSESKTYKGKFDICIVHWPDKRPIGMHTITNYPPSIVSINTLRPYLRPEIIGNENEVFDWIDNIKSKNNRI